ncbi:MULTISPECIES: metal-dependent hydrolase [unclassified Haloparvum]|uniref:metal-dependent hydrolase n=1 Tax=Haloparvum sp. PAK95 TaxID=3418962 RepID=UPI003D2F3C36
MMSPTHIVAGPVLAIPVLVFAPELAVVAAVAAICGGILPDLDLLAGEHRKTLHFPLLYWIPTVPAVVAAVLAPAPATVGAALFFLAAAIHSIVDVFGGGYALKPWEVRSKRGVYFHRGQRWLRPKRWIRYDGSPEDVGMAVLLAIPGLRWYADPVPTLVAGALVVAVVYAALRKRLPPYLEPIVN